MSRWLRVRANLDRIIAAILLLPAAPVIAVLGWLVHRHDGGPALVKVPRVGQGGRSLPMWKLRSMRAETADGRAAGSGLTSAGDDRVTPIGRRLRALHLDELPQLYNVLRGEMALLGPRPEDPAYVDLGDPRWADVLASPPGIAGPTQLVVGDWERTVITAAPDGSGYRAEVLPVKLAIDRWYVREASPSLDAMVALGVLRRMAGHRSIALDRRVGRDVPSAALALPAPPTPSPTRSRS